jgi:hypothetical protein
MAGAEFDRIQSYIEENPVSAGLVSEARQHPWPSAASRLKGGCGQDWPPHIFKTQWYFRYLLAHVGGLIVVLHPQVSNQIFSPHPA